MPPQPARTRLILAAERLFAEHGIAATSLRQVNAAAGQRNKSAVHYHFGSKAALVEAIFERRMTAIDRRRSAWLDAIEIPGAEPSVRDYVEAIVVPLVEELEEEGGSEYLRLLGQVRHDPEAWVLAAFRGKFDAAAVRAMRGIQRRLAGLPAALRRQRSADLIAQYSSALADRETRRSRGDAGPELPLPVFVSNLIDTLAGALSAPVSAATTRELRGRRQRASA